MADKYPFVRTYAVAYVTVKTAGLSRRQLLDMLRIEQQNIERHERLLEQAYDNYDRIVLELESLPDNGKENEDVDIP